MTIAIGISCPTGAALVTDSMTMRTHPDGAVEGFLSAEHKTGRTGELVYVHSGGAPEDWQPEPEPAVGFVAEARALYAALVTAPRACAVPVAAGSDLAEMGRLAEQDLIVAAVAPRSFPNMALLTRDAEQWAGPDGAIFVAGAPTLWAKDRGIAELPVPKSPRGCADLALRIGCDFIAHHYAGRAGLDDFARDGLIPPVAYPLHLQLITDAGVARFEYQP